MHFNLVKIVQEGAQSPHFDDVILPLYYALCRLGYNVKVSVNFINTLSINILFGTCNIPGFLDEHLPANTIIFNLEQISSNNNPWSNTKYIEHLRRFTVWDYSRRNAGFLRKSMGLENVMEVRLGYVPEMTRLACDYPQDIDVLFYGAVNERRGHTLDALKEAGLRTVVLTDAYGLERDHFIARSRCVLNVHFYTPATLEIARLGYLWANRKAVVSERQKTTEIDSGLEESCRFCLYDDLVAATCEIARSKTAGTRQGEAGYAAFTALRQEDFLEAVVGRRTHGGQGIRLPKKLNAGSGKNFRPDCLNIDINPSMNPDLVLDLSHPPDSTAGYATARFGEIRLTAGMFTQITAFELLEHVHNLPQLMRNFLDMLTEGGELQISVPYDLSLSAWQDPTHIRAFNEQSWIYYGDWSWYMGWRDACFDLKDLSFTLSEYGRRLISEGRTHDELLRVPRAIDGMYVILCKRKKTLEEKITYDAVTRAFYNKNIGVWSVHDLCAK
ncbi:MAG: class I SAM-dependent methyltransferase [Desulfovibrio sp.]|jgi:SAM-dependent methyltransferase|nr:class I SAM-dependent methyltransferase [Desulfovibrio sp.]